MRSAKKVLRLKKISENGFEKVSENGLLLHGIDIFRFQISIHTLQLDVPEKYSR